MKPVLGVFEVEDKQGQYNVWRYDTPQTQCILFCHQAKSKSAAKNDALEKIKALEEQQKKEDCKYLHKPFLPPAQ